MKKISKIKLSSTVLHISDLNKKYNMECDSLNLLLKSYVNFNNKITEECDTGIRMIQLNKFYESILYLEFKISKKKKKF
ncbi:hypothetical protein [Buchnera aphidicola]|uniref:hypothetical protein n=1 Tax=Buchnera aphidicola TaxID=9 RepID=UPI0034643D77